jgi:hypothetical protein
VGKLNFYLLVDAKNNIIATQDKYDTKNILAYIYIRKTSIADLENAEYTVDID